MCSKQRRSELLISTSTVKTDVLQEHNYWQRRRSSSLQKYSFGVCRCFRQFFVIKILGLRTNSAVQNSLLRPLDQEKNYLFTFKDTQIISYSNYRTLSVVMMSFIKYYRNYFRSIEEGGGRGAIIANSEKAAVFLIFSVSIFRTDMMIRQKVPQEVLITEQ